MWVKCTVDGSEVTVCLEYIASIAKSQDVIGYVAHYLYDHGKGDHGTDEEPTTFEDLSNQDKLDLVDAHVKQVILDLSNTYMINVAKEAARIAAESDIAETHDLG